MAYSNPLDPTTPSSTALRSEGDDRIREAKAAIRERLLTVFQDLDVDPLAFIAGIIPTAALADLSVTLGKLAANSVDASKIVDGQVTLPKIPDGILTYPKILPALSAKWVQVRKATVVFSNGQLFNTGTVTDYATGLAVSGVSIDWSCCLGALDKNWPSLKLIVTPIVDTGFIKIRVANIGTNETLTQAYPLSVYVIETLAP